MKYVIIGNSIAATACIEGIRSVDKEGGIAVISAENYPVYGRPLISYCLLGRVKRENMGYRPDDFYGKNDVSVYYGRTATRLYSITARRLSTKNCSLQRVRAPLFRPCRGWTASRINSRS